MTERCCQVRLKGSLNQILEIIEDSGQGISKMPPYPKLLDALAQHNYIRVTFDDPPEARGTSLELNIPVRVTESMGSVVAKVKNRRDVVALEIEPGWRLLKEMIGFEGVDANQQNSEAYEPINIEKECHDDTEDDYGEEDNTVFPLIDIELEFVTNVVNRLPQKPYCRCCNHSVSTGGTC
jgi:hypothetical protein